MRMDFVKMHGLGNDFVMVEDLEGSFEPEPGVVATVCERHFGVGADGLIAVRRGPDPDTFYMHYINADGSLAEMCGNGIRCLAKYVVDRGLTDAELFIVHTLGGPKEIRVRRGPDGTLDAATVDMGRPILDPTRIPVRAGGETARSVPIETPGGSLEFTMVSMGNPHAITFVDDVAVAPVETVGPFVETHEVFPQKTNVEFAHVLDRGRIRLRVWERGVGETLACGTGACATVVAGSLLELTEREVAVELPGGVLEVAWTDDDRVLMTGPASEVFTGTFDI
jgi:diaminopimelate epimerase